MVRQGRFHVFDRAVFFLQGRQNVVKGLAHVIHEGDPMLQNVGFKGAGGKFTLEHKGGPGNHDGQNPHIPGIGVKQGHADIAPVLFFQAHRALDHGPCPDHL